jgi:multicomponent Na+:H+ antiporter subunit C
VFAYLVAVWLLLIGLYGVVTSRHLVHLVLCIGVM